MGQIAPIHETFTATIEVRGNWACVTWPGSVAFFGSTRPVKVRGTMNGIAFQTAFCPGVMAPNSCRSVRNCSRLCGHNLVMLLKCTWRNDFERSILSWTRQE